MPNSTLTFRVFVSSTFEDLKDERDALQRNVFPKLRTFCEQHGARFQAIDLRWGVREETGLYQKTMEVCLAEIARCRKTGIKPNFIVLLGDRYGWLPLPARIKKDEFEIVLAYIADISERNVVQSWYALDFNAQLPEYLLKRRSDAYAEWVQWEPVERRMHSKLCEAARAAGLSHKDLVKYEASATHQEILKGLGETSDDRKHVFAFFRESAGTEDPDLGRLKAYLKRELPEVNILPYAAGNHAQLCDAVETSLKTVIAATADRFEPLSENASHDQFAEDRTRHFIGRQGLLNAIEEYLYGDDKRPLVVHGPSGSGKSAIMAVASKGKSAVRRFVGATPESSSGITLLRSLCQELGEHFGQAGNVPATFSELSVMFSDRLRLATADRPLILFIDALDQLAAQDPATAMTWLPAELPPHCRVVLSTTEIAAAVQRAATVPVEPLPVEEAGLALDAWFAEAGRTLQPEQRGKLLASFRKSGLPLYLKLAFEEARLWRSDQLEECVLGDGLAGIIDRLFARLSSPANHGQTLVSHALGYLTAARYGLTEDEILAVLTKDDAVWKDVIGEGERRRHDPPARQLPAIVWSRLYLDLEPYLTERTVPGGTTISFFHRQLGERVETTPFHHEGLATYFGEQSHWLGAGVPNQRKITELVRQQVGARLLGDVERVLTDLDFVAAKCAAELMFDLEEDYREVIATLPEAQKELAEEESRKAQAAGWIATLIDCAEQKRLPTKDEIPQSIELWTEGRITEECRRIIENPARLDRLRAFAGFVEQELFALIEFGKRPGFVLQHGFNSAPAGPVHHAASHDIDSATAPMLLRRWPADAAYNPKAALLRTMEGHRGGVASVSVTLDGRRAVSGSYDRTLRVWDLKTGECLRTLEGHTNWVQSVNAILDGRRAVSASYDHTVRVWDLDTGACLWTLTGHTGEVGSVSATPDGRLAVSASKDRMLRLWNLETGACLRTLAGHTDEVGSVSVTPDGRRAVSASHDDTLRVWDLETGECVRTMNGMGDYSSVSVTPDGRRAVSGGSGHTLRVWDLETSECLLTLEGHTCGVRTVGVTPDGMWAVSGSDDSTLRVWNLQTGECLRTLNAMDWVLSVAVTPDGRRAVSGNQGLTLKLWDLETGLETGRCPRAPAGHASWVDCASVSSDGRRAVSASFDRTLRVWELETGAPLRTLEGHTDKVRKVSMTPDGHRAISTSDDHALRLWDLETGSCLRTLEGRFGDLGSVSVTPDGRRAVTATNGGLWEWDLETGACLRILAGHSSSVWSVSVTPDGRRAVSGGNDETLRVWDLETGVCLRTLRGHSSAVTSVGITPDGRRAVSTSAISTSRECNLLLVWDLEMGACLRILAGHTSSVWSLSVMPDGRSAVSVSTDCTLRAWDLETGECLAIVRLGAAGTAVAAACDRVVAGTSVGEVIFFDVRGLDLTDLPADTAGSPDLRSSLIEVAVHLGLATEASAVRILRPGSVM